MLELKQELVESLKGASRFKEAAELVDPSTEFDCALDCYLRANDF